MGNTIRKIYRKKLKCPKCKKKLFVIYDMSPGIEVTCKNCDTVFVGFNKKSDLNNE